MGIWVSGRFRVGAKVLEWKAELNRQAEKAAPRTKADYIELLIDCVNNRTKNRWLLETEKWHSLAALDLAPFCKLNVSHDLCDLPLPFSDNSFDGIHVYEMLEHTGHQGDYGLFFVVRGGRQSAGSNERRWT